MNKKSIIINEYKVMINEENATCGLIVNKEKYNIKNLKDKKLSYKVKYQEAMIVINCGFDEIVFNNADKQLLYYAVKALKLEIFCMSDKETRFSEILYAYLE